MPRKVKTLTVQSLEKENAKAALAPPILTPAEVRDQLRGMMPNVLSAMSRTLADPETRPQDVLGIAKYITEYGYPELQTEDAPEEDGAALIIEYADNDEGASNE